MFLMIDITDRYLGTERCGTSTFPCCGPSWPWPKPPAPPVPPTGRSVPRHGARHADRRRSLFPDRLVWAGAPGGRAWLETPLPLALGDDSCAFRDPIVEILRRAGRPWRTVCEWSDIGAILAVCEADTGVAALLQSTIPYGLVAVPHEAQLPALPTFNVNLYPPRADAGRAAHELARLLRQSLGSAAAPAASTWRPEQPARPGRSVRSARRSRPRPVPARRAASRAGRATAVIRPSARNGASARMMVGKRRSGIEVVRQARTKCSEASQQM